MSALVTHRFFLKPPPLDAGEQQVYLRLIVNRKKAELATGVKVKPLEWNAERGRTQRNRIANEMLEAWEAKVLALKHTDFLKGQARTASEVKALLTDNLEQTETVVGYLQSHVDRMAARTNEYAKGSLTPYRSTVRWFTRYLASIKKSSIQLSQLTRSHCLNFEHFMLTTPLEGLGRPMLRNVASKHLSRLRTMLNAAVREERLEKNPMTGITLKQERTNREFLTAEELARLASLDLSRNASLERVRDIFMFSVYSGLRYKDAMSLELKHLSLDAQGRSWLSIVQQKTGDALRVPLLQEALRVLDKHKDEARITGKLLPRLSNQKLNAYLKVLADLAEITRPLTHHVARHTFATSITLSNNVSLEVVSKLLGHQNLKTTQIYAKITADHLGSVATRLDATLAR